MCLQYLDTAACTDPAAPFFVRRHSGTISCCLPACLSISPVRLSFCLFMTVYLPDSVAQVFFLQCLRLCLSIPFLPPSSSISNGPQHHSIALEAMYPAMTKPKAKNRWNGLSPFNSALDIFVLQINWCQATWAYILGQRQKIDLKSIYCGSVPGQTDYF